MKTSGSKFSVRALLAMLLCMAFATTAYAHGVAQGDQGYISGDMFEPVEEEDNAEQEQQMVITRDHMLAAQIEERDDLRSAGLFNIALISLCDPVGIGSGREDQAQ